MLAALDRIMSFALPPRCPGCGEVTLVDHVFCAACWHGLDFLGPPECAVCGEPMALDPGPDGRCTPCVAEPPAFDRARAAVAYGGIARALTLRLKHGGRTGIAETIARLTERLIGEDAGGLVVAPVPLHRERIWRRGYNQAALIARSLARARGLAYAPGLVRRTRATPMLRGLGRAARADAVRGAFAVDPARPVAGARVLLVDDVYTTGATADACARALKGAGAAEVRLLCWARVVRRQDVDK